MVRNYSLLCLRELCNMKGYITRRDVRDVLRSTEEEAQSYISYLVRTNRIQRVHGYSMPFRFEFVKTEQEIIYGVLESAEA